MGRTLQPDRQIGAVRGDCETDAYNLAGLPTTITSLGYSVGYTYNGAGRALGATNFLGSTTKFVSAATYAPPGELAGCVVNFRDFSLTVVTALVLISILRELKRERDSSHASGQAIRTVIASSMGFMCLALNLGFLPRGVLRIGGIAASCIGIAVLAMFDLQSGFSDRKER
jgi:YD repeat-containing protein